MKASNAVIDKGIEEWAKANKSSLEKSYDRVVQVGQEEELPERADDKDIADYCRKHDCVLFTPDLTFFQDGFFKVGIKSVKITGYDWWNKKYILLIEIPRQHTTGDSNLDAV